MKKGKEATSLLMAVVISVSNLLSPLPVIAAEQIQTEQMEQTEELTEQSETETGSESEMPVQLYEVLLKEMDGCTYQYDHAKVKETSDKSVILAYAPEEAVEIGITAEDGLHVEQVQVLSGKEEIPCSWKEETCEFRMPEKNVELRVTIEENSDAKETETESNLTETGPPEEEQTEKKVPEAETEAVPEQQTETETEARPVPEPSKETDAQTLLPNTGSIEVVEALAIPYDTWDFDPEKDFRNIPYEADGYEITLISENITYDKPGKYETVYRVDKSSEEYWFVVRPILVEDPSESEPVTESETETMTGAIEIPVTEAESETEEQTNILMESESEAETETEAETDTEKETAEETSASERTEVSEDELYRMTLPDLGETVTLKKRTVWSQDQKFDVKDYHPESATLVGADVVWLKGEIDYSGEDISEVTYQATLQEDPAYQWYVVVPFTVTDKKEDADTGSNDYDNIFYLESYGDTSHAGKLPTYIGETVQGEGIHVKAGEPFQLLDVNLDYDWDIFGMDLLDDGGFDVSKTGTYTVIYELYAWSDLSQTFKVQCQATVEDAEQESGTAVVHIVSGEVECLVTEADGKTSLAKYGTDYTGKAQMLELTARSPYGHQITPKVTVYKDGTVADGCVLEQNMTENGTVYVMDLKEGHTYQILADVTGYEDTGKADKRSDEWVWEDGMELSSMRASTSKTWSGKSTVVKSLQTYGSDSGASAVGAKSKAHVTLQSSLRTKIKSWIEETLKLDMESAIPTKMDVKCTTPGSGYGHWGWYTSGALSQCCSGATMKATLMTDKNNKPTKIKLTMTLKGANGFQTFGGTTYIKVEEGGGTLTLKKRSASDNLVKTFSDIQVDTAFVIYEDEACTKQAADVDISPASASATEVSQVVELDEGTYWIVETARMPGHAWDTHKYKITVNNGENTSLTVTNKPFYFNGTFLVKKDKKTQTPLAGAVFQVKGTRSGKAVGTWYFKTDSDGKISYDTAHYLAAWKTQKSDALYQINDTVGVGLPESTVLTVKEVEAPEGYVLDSREYSVGVSDHTDGKELQAVKLTCTPLNVTNDKDEGYLYLEKTDQVLGTKVPEPYSLKGAVYGVYDSTGKRVAGLTTQENGRTETIAVKTGTYQIREETAPSGYHISDEVVSVTVTAGNTENAPIAVHVTEKPETGKLKIIKAPDEKEDPKIWEKRDLSEVVFELTYVADTSIKVRIQLNEKGEGMAENLYFGDWELTEITPPKYHKPMEKEIITIDEESVYEAEIVNHLKEAAIVIEKRDADTGNLITRSQTTFQILDEAGKTISLQVKGKKEKTDTFQTAEDGTVQFEETLPAGTYTIHELIPPKGYQRAEDVTVELAEEGDLEHPVVVTVTDKRAQYTPVKVKKLDADSQEMAGAGFTFAVLAEEDILDGAGKAYPGYEKDAVIEKIRTDETGWAQTTKLLYPGTYRIEETEAADHYQLNTKQKLTFKVVEKEPEKEGADWKTDIEILGGLEDLVFSNDPVKRPIRVKKTDAVTGSPAGAEFVFEIKADEVKDGSGHTRKGYEKGTVVDTITTNEESVAESKPLYTGTYLVKEIVRIRGYLLSETEYPVQITDGEKTGEPVELAISDEPMKKKVQVTKVDEETGKHLGAGYVFEITASEDIADCAGETYVKEGEIVDRITTDEDGIAVSKELFLGHYYVQEVEVPDTGMAINPDRFEFELTDELDEEGNLVNPEDQTMILPLDDIKDKPTAVKIRKTDSVDGKVLSGITFRVKEADAEDAEDQLYVTDENGEICVPYLKKNGTYMVTETATIPGYNLNTETYTFEVDENGLIDGKAEYELEITNQPNAVQVSKTDITGEKEIPGAQLKITSAEDDAVMDEWTSTEEPHFVYGLPAGTYYLTETLPPKGYVTSETVMFEVTDSLEVQKVTMQDEVTKVQISKKDITTKEELPGASLEIRNEDGETVESWVSTEEPHYIEMLPIGTYTLTETAAPEYYAKAETITFEVTDTKDIQKVEMLDEKIRVAVSKKDITGKKELPGAKLTVKDVKGNQIEEWVSEETPHEMNLAAGEYTLIEVTAPEGYEVAENVTFTVTDSLEVQPVTMYDEPKDTLVDLTGKTKTTTTGGGTPSSSGGGNVIAQMVQTGDINRYLPAIVLILSGVGMAGICLLRRKKKKD